ncbi:DNA alkylation response protein [Rhodococcus sp. 06-156-3C]|uniref:acyl-CoA dehydrogenase family protein n=1 Tax=Nocardiaceae TaxID=85025 RepID=UPI0003764C1B|nr:MULTISPECIES: acyl-CoA dehydrogenase family protein [Rhodococcus]OZD11763.1 DNA alkylation response protein [Rhodococcus sp. 06-156-4C]OZD15607.1 DNA alkylation response protein [Rhodococcus sp. 06-156-4a]OZD23773.1 DNA alkylation response protein [Rhodococcus sp. 06-156-3C]OZD27155.1 DNA alkylation response protein [Rhodococcus sp. 06-156-3b]OZD31450.1 DNA alkylation response protein [Rhodococcus sp. 06-156-3]
MTFPATHTVFNQVPDLLPYDTSDDASLLEGLRREGGGWAEDEVRQLGARAGSVEAQEWGRLANENPPVLHTHDRYGNRVDEVEFHPHWHDLMNVAIENGLHATPWQDARPGAHVARAAKFYAWGQADAGHMCPISMTYAAVPALRHNPDLAETYEPLLASTHYDFGLRIPTDKRGLTAGMSMTEKQGGSDVRSGTTTATPSADGTYTIVGHKWFTSAPMSDMFLTLAQAPGGLSCFLLPRVLPDGSLNRIQVQRLKDKLGNKSNASGELEYLGATGWLVGDEGRGVKTIIEMVNMTRLDCVIGSAAGMRNAAVRAVHHARHRSAFGAALIEQPLMRNVLSDLIVESEAATAAMIRLAGATDRSARGDTQETELRRITLAITKYWVCKRAPSHAAEALECLGGNGYVEESGMPRLFRESPLMSIWEGSGNVAALDSLRALAKQPDVVEAYFTEVTSAAGADSRLDDAIARVGKELADSTDMEYRARRVVELMALVFQGSLLVRHGDPAVADAFCASRLGEDWGGAFGTLPTGLDTAAIVARI